MARLAFLGLGKMGGGMAGRLLAAGHELSVWNRSAAKAAPLVARGARLSPTPREAAGGAAAIFAMVADDAASEAVWFGADGALAAAAPGTFVIECSTLSAAHVGRLAAAAAARGLAYVDCPVTGLPKAAAEGQLALLVGADPAVLARARPLLEPVSRVIRHFGPIGTGTGFKLINNLMGAVHIAALAEGLSLAERLGLDRETTIQAIEGGAIASPQVTRYCRPMAEHAYSATPPFSVGLRHKDASYCLAQAAAAGAAMPIGEAATRWFAAAKAVGFDDDEASVIEPMRR